MFQVIRVDTLESSNEKQSTRLIRTLRENKLGTVAFLTSSIIHLLLVIPWIAKERPGLTANNTFGYENMTEAKLDEGLAVELTHSQKQTEPNLGDQAEASSDPLSTLSDDVSSEPQPSDINTRPEHLLEPLSSFLSDTAHSPTLGPIDKDSFVAPDEPGDGGGSSHAQSDLWKAIEPCWRKLGGVAEPLILKVSFSAMGNVSGEPTFLDLQGGSQSEHQLAASKERAFTALRQCGPYVQAYGQTEVEISFPKE